MPSIFPDNVTDGTQIIDVDGILWRYTSSSDLWINLGPIELPPVATDDTDGLVATDAYELITSIKALDSEYLRLFKIYPALNAYWYFLTSTNKSVKFIPESSNDLRFEINLPRLYALLAQYRCPGTRGSRGPQGQKGRAGRPGRSEATYSAVFSGTTIAVERNVQSTIGTPISFRLYRNESITPCLDIRLPLDGSESTVYSIIGVKLLSSTLRYISGVVRGDITLESVDPSDVWEYKVSEIGPRGPRGADGSNFVQIIENNFYNDELKATKALISLRKHNNSLLYVTSNIYTDNCVGKLSFDRGCKEFSTKFELSLASVDITTEQCKKIGRYTFVPGKAVYGTYEGGDGSDLVPPKLLLPDWTPTATCWQQRHWSISNFNWADFTKVDTDNLPWHTANEQQARNPAYPWIINIPHPPGSKCCSEDAFYCANINDNPCGVVNPTGDVPVLRPPSVSQACCECDCPISLDLQDGYDFDEIAITADRKILVGVGDIHEYSHPCQNVRCTLDGIIHEYRQRIVIQESRLPVSFTINIKADYDDLCEETRDAYFADLEKTNRHPAFTLDCGQAVAIADCPFQWSVRDVSNDSELPGHDILERTGPGYVVASNGDVVSMTFTGQAGVVDLSILVNLQYASCCLGYGLEVCVDQQNSEDFYDDDEPTPSIPPTPSMPPLTISSVAKSPCGSCPNNEDAVQWSIDLSGFSGEYKYLNNRYLCYNQVAGDTYVSVGTPVSSTHSSTGFATLLADYNINDGKLYVVLVECSVNGTSVDPGIFGIIWEFNISCNQLIGSLPVKQSIDSSFGKLTCDIVGASSGGL